MVAAGAIRAGRAFIELGIRDMTGRMLRSIGNRFNAFGNEIINLGFRIQVAFAGIAAPLGFAVNIAAELEATIRRLGAVFGDSAGEVEAWGRSLAQSAGRADRDVLRALGAFQTAFKREGLDPAEAERLSKAYAQMAVDFAAFQGIDLAQAVQKFVGVLGGEAESIDQFGLDVKEAAVNAKLLEMGLKTTAEGASEMTKRMVRMQLMMEQMSDKGMEGAAQVMRDTFLVQVSALRAEFERLGEEVGKVLMPILTEWGASLLRIVTGVRDWVKNNQELIASIAKIVGKVLLWGSVILAAAFAIKLFGAAIALVGSLIVALVSPVGLITMAILGLIGLVLYATGAFEGLASVLSQVIEYIKAGDIQSAIDLALAEIQARWNSTLITMGDMWDAFITTVIEMAARMGAEIVKAMMRASLVMIPFIDDLEKRLESQLAKRNEARNKRFNENQKLLGAIEEDLREQKKAIAEQHEGYLERMEAQRKELEDKTLVPTDETNALLSELASRFERDDKEDDKKRPASAKEMKTMFFGSKADAMHTNAMKQTALMESMASLLASIDSKTPDEPVFGAV